ncbi:phosphonate C-P lyase system protein PhnG [Frigidibacter sp. ROC022]|uniref:phosphonate C-P lyase system protein PhnG n=1 Tax=Frigidibacter sp. ROC022 TaxID=2971796 RepID=UPI00215B56EF|nr:phosphonate C-P lyase system protein PhnG [Frigidibacter sp. ROC022]MCR8725036.1 phosphonate C-P lyase system protein PhnG [Frigidibacter sp. ROC022]
MSTAASAAPADPDQAARQGWIGLLARAPARRLAALFPELPAHEPLRRPETGTVMVRGRLGATGAAFNLGEMTVTRCSLRLASGAVGHAQVQGRNKGHALRAAALDALMQGPEAERLRRQVLDPLAAEEAARRANRAAKAAATKVDFFTMVRGEDS